jgi:hypothetical protein
MGKVAYTPEQASKATGAVLALILESIRLDHLPARDIEGVPVIMRRDLKTWVESFPAWRR